MLVVDQSSLEAVRVLMIGAYPRTPDRINGGVAAALMYLSEALVESGAVELIGVRISKNESDICDQSKFGWAMLDLPLGSFSLTTLYWRQRRMLERLIDEYRPDIVHAQGADISGYLAVRSGRPAVITVHGLLAECAKFQTAGLSRLRASLAAAVTERGTIRRSEALIAISPFVTKYYEGDITGTVHDIPNAVSNTFFGVDRAAQVGRFLFAGRIANGKGLVELVHAFSQANEPHWVLVLAGATPEPDYEKKLREEVDTLGLSGRVRFVGLLDESSLINEFSIAQALILPSYQETAPMVIQQSMASGLPVIASSVGGIPFQITHNETGLMFPAGDVVELGALMRQVATRTGWAEALGVAARTEALRHFHANAVAASTAKVYRQVLASRAHDSDHRRTRN